MKLNVKYFGYFMFGCLALLQMSCSTTRFVEPLEVGETAVGVNGGGPLIALGDQSLPIPLSSVFVGYGYRENLTFYGGLHTTSLLYKTLQLDLGIRRNLFESTGIYPSVSWAGALNVITDFRENNFRIYPELMVNPYWNYGSWKTYTGIQLWFDLYKFNQQNYGYGGIFVPAIQVGQSYEFRSFTLSLEYKRLGFNVPSQNSVVNYIGASKGAHGIYFSVFKTFGYEKQE